jgi:Flp pilus assembly pilin Flp
LRRDENPLFTPLVESPLLGVQSREFPTKIRSLLLCLGSCSPISKVHMRVNAKPFRIHEEGEVQMFNLMNAFKKFLKDESAQGATEYILLLVAVVAILTMFRGRIMTVVQDLIGNLSGQIQQASQP